MAARPGGVRIGKPLRAVANHRCTRALPFQMLQTYSSSAGWA
jgi:hypothetical protein